MKSTIPKSIARFAGAVLLAAASIWTARADDFSTLLLSHGPLAYWQFTSTATSPTPYVFANHGSVGSVGDAHALSTVGSGVPGIVNSCASFTNLNGGTGDGNSKADVYYNAGLNPAVFSIEFWANPTAQNLSIDAADGASTGLCPMSSFNPNGSGGARSGWLIYLNPASGGGGAWNFRLGLNSGYAATMVANSSFAQAGIWQHIVVTYDSTNLNMYVNGTLVKSAVSIAASTGWHPNNGSFLRFGGTPLVGSYASVTDDDNYYLPWDQNTTASGNRCWDGQLDEVAIYTNVLAASTVLAHYQARNTPGTYGSTILAANPAGYWNFDEPAVTVPDPSTFPAAANSGSLGSAADGTNVWGAVANQPGPGYAGIPVTDKAVTFDGMSGSLVVNPAPGLIFPASGSTITMAAWVKPLASNYKGDIIEQGYETVFGAETFLRVSRGYGYGNFTGSGYYEVGTTEGAQNDGFYDAAQFPIPPGDLGNWVFLVGTFDGSNWNLYRNGVLVGTQAADGDDYGPYNLENNWTIGSRCTNSFYFWDGNFFAGSIAEPAIFGTALSASDIQSLYNAAKVPPVITQAPVNPGIVSSGNTVTLTVLADGSPTLGYLWTSNGIPTSDTTTSYSIPNIAVGTYTIAVIVTNAYGTNTPSVTFTAVPAPPSITTAPIGLTRFVGSPFSFSVGVGGTPPFTYYWLSGSTVVQAGPSATYSGVASMANAGSYSVIVSNITSINVTSAPVSLVVNPVPTGYAAAVAASTPISYWRLGEAGGSIAYDTIGGNNGVYNTTTLGVPGYSVLDPDTAASFSGDNSYVGSISGSAINFTGNTVFTLEAWVNAPAGQNDEATIIAKGIGANGTVETEQFALDVVGGAYRFFTTYNGTAGPNGDGKYEAIGVTGPNGTWQHVVGVYDGNNSLGGGTNMYIYVNGVLEGSVTPPVKGPTAITSAVSIGSKKLGNDPTFNGTFNGAIDEVAIYNYALSESTIQAHYAAAYGPSLAPFILLEPSPTTNYVGLPAVISVVAAGTVPLTYQWYKGAVALSDGGTISGSASGTLTISSTAYTDADNYHVFISNTVGNTNSVTVPLVVLAPPATPPSISGLVVHLPLTSTLNDSTGRGNNGTSHGISYVPDGPLGLSALHYSTDPGSGTNYVSLGVRPDLQFGSNISFSVAFWIRLPINYQGGDLPFFTDTTGSTFGKGFVFAPTYGEFATQSPNTTTAVDGGWAYSVFDGSNAGIGGHGPADSINDGNWHHLVYVLDRTKGSVAYLDGTASPFTKQQGTSIKAAGNIDTGLSANIGQDPTGTYDENGSADIADLGVWNRALKPLEAASIYVAGVSNQLSYTSGTVPPNSINIISVSKSGNSVTINWSPTPAAPTPSYYSYSVLSSTSLNGGTWVTNMFGITTTNYTDTVLPSTTQKFYKVTAP
jgi:Concanavalin A-like lectin/glucanases superfamily